MPNPQPQTPQQIAEQIVGMLIKQDTVDGVMLGESMKDRIEPLIAAALADAVAAKEGEWKALTQKAGAELTNYFLAKLEAAEAQLTELKAKETAYEVAIRNLTETNSKLEAQLTEVRAVLGATVDEDAEAAAKRAVQGWNDRHHECQSLRAQLTDARRAALEEAAQYAVEHGWQNGRIIAAALRARTQEPGV